MPIIDHEMLMEHIDGDLEFLQETYQIFCEDSQEMQDALCAAFQSGDLKAIHSHAHMIKGMLSNFMAKPACDTVSQIEQVDSANAILAATPLLETLSNQIDLMHIELRQTIESGAGS